MAGAEAGVRALERCGFPRNAISTMGSESDLSQEMETVQRQRWPVIGAGALFGAGAGAVIAGFSLAAIPGAGPIGAGVLFAAIGALAGAVFASFAGGILTAATELQESGQTDRAVAERKVIVGVEADDAEIEKAKQALLTAGGQSAVGEPGTLSADQPLLRPVE